VKGLVSGRVRLAMVPATRSLDTRSDTKSKVPIGSRVFLLASLLSRESAAYSSRHLRIVPDIITQLSMSHRPHRQRMESFQQLALLAQPAYKSAAARSPLILTDTAPYREPAYQMVLDCRRAEIAPPPS